MRKLRKLCLVTTLLLVLSFFAAAPVSAATLINSTQNGIIDSGTLRITWSANTLCTRYVDRGTLSIYIQRYISGAWYTVATDSDEEFDDILINDGDSLYVSTAGQYRIRSVHYVEDDGEHQAVTRTSSTITVD